MHPPEYGNNPHDHHHIKMIKVITNQNRFVVNSKAQHFVTVCFAFVPRSIECFELGKSYQNAFPNSIEMETYPKGILSIHFGRHVIVPFH